MSEDTKEEHAGEPSEKPETPPTADKPSAPRRRALPKGAARPGPLSGWVVLAVIAATFLAMRMMNPNRPVFDSISQTEFRALVESGQIVRMWEPSPIRSDVLRNYRGQLILLLLVLVASVPTAILGLIIEKTLADVFCGHVLTLQRHKKVSFTLCCISRHHCGKQQQKQSNSFHIAIY